MQTFTHGALPGIIAASALGALIMCLLVLRFGLTPSADETAAQAQRRLFLTRLGHAFAGACFAVTAMLAVVVFVERPRPVLPAAAVAAEVAERLEAGTRSLDARLQAIEEKLGKTEAAAARAEARAGGAESLARGLGEEVAQASARLRQWERERAAAAAEARAAAAKRSPTSGDGARPAPRAVIRRDTSAPSPPVPAPAAASPLPAPVATGVVPAPPPAPRPESAREAPVEARPLPLATEPVESVPRHEPAGRPPAADGPISREPASGPAPPADIRNKVLRDWESIKQGFRDAGRDLENAVTEHGRKLRDTFR